jgi:hypothetical protein
MSEANKLMLEGLEQLNQMITEKEVVEYKPTTTTDKTFCVFFSKDNIAYDAMFRLDDDGRMNYHYREVEEDPELTMISFGATAVDETKKGMKIHINGNWSVYYDFFKTFSILEEKAIEDYWAWRQELGTDFDECSMRV